MPENIVVGAGLAGLVCAINLAREGREVLVIDRERRIGGSPIYHPSPQGTPIDLEGIRAYTGIDISPAVKEFTSGKAVVYGEVVPVDMGAISSYMVERGPRSSSLDSYLYSLALEAGVKFEFGTGFLSADDFMQLPPDSVVATGLHFEGFDSCNVPYLTSFHYLGRKKIDDAGSTHVTVYHDEFTTDYAYTSSINGVLLAHFFQRYPVKKDALKRFEERVYITEGFEFDHWEHFTFPVPAASIKNPRLFWGRIILAGTLCGCMESYMFFGIHGALVSGKIAAIAVADRGRAYEEFLNAVSPFRPAYVLKKFLSFMPRTIYGAGLKMALRRLPVDERIARFAKSGMPGWRNCQSAKGS